MKPEAIDCLFCGAAIDPSDPCPVCKPSAPWRIDDGYIGDNGSHKRPHAEDLVTLLDESGDLIISGIQRFRAERILSKVNVVLRNAHDAALRANKTATECDVCMASIYRIVQRSANRNIRHG